MSLILALRDGQYFLAAFAPHLNGCNLSTPVRPHDSGDKFHLWNGSVWVWSHAPLKGTRFFPLVRVNGSRVTPLSWSSRHDEPRVVCAVEEKDMDWERWFGRAPSPYQERVALMQSAGWSWDIRDESGARACRIEELELIEGPPPEGAF